MSDATILLVDDDAVLSQVLRRVLTRQGYDIVEAGSIAEALEKARERRPRLGLIDLCLPDGDGVELARRLEQEVGPLPLILMTAYPLRLRDQPQLAQGFAHVLTKPLNIEELRQVVDRALASAPAEPPAALVAAATAAPTPLADATLHQTEPAPTTSAAPAVAPRGPSRLVWWLAPAASAAVVAGAFLLWPRISFSSPAEWFKAATATPPPPPPPSAVRPVAGDPDGIEVDPGVVEKLGVTTAVLSDKIATRPLELAGSLAFDPNRLYGIQSRFPGEVLALGKFTPPGSSEESEGLPRRDLNYGDEVREGQLLAIVLSKDLGEKKSELLDALSKLALDEDTLRRYTQGSSSGAIPVQSIREAERNVQSDVIAANKAELTLLTWRVPEREIQAVKDEAKRLEQPGAKRDLEKETSWAKVYVTSPAAGRIVEKNVAVGRIVDTAFDLYKIANLKKLGVLVHAYEEDLRALQALPRGSPWQVRVSANPRAPVLQSDGLEQLGMVIDPNQHTDPVMGRVDNAGGELKVGQFVTATVELEAPPGVVAVPASALDENGSDSVVFVQPDASRLVYQMRRVLVTQRLHDVVYVRRELTAAQKARGLSPLAPGERVVTQGVVELKAALEDVQAKKQP